MEKIYSDKSSADVPSEEDDSWQVLGESFRNDETAWKAKAANPSTQVREKASPISNLSTNDPVVGIIFDNDCQRSIDFPLDEDDSWEDLGETFESDENEWKPEAASPTAQVNESQVLISKVTTEDSLAGNVMSNVYQLEKKQTSLSEFKTVPLIKKNKNRRNPILCQVQKFRRGNYICHKKTYTSHMEYKVRIDKLKYENKQQRQFDTIALVKVIFLLAFLISPVFLLPWFWRELAGMANFLLSLPSPIWFELGCCFTLIGMISISPFCKGSHTDSDFLMLLIFVWNNFGLLHENPISLSEIVPSMKKGLNRRNSKGSLNQDHQLGFGNYVIYKKTCSEYTEYKMAIYKHKYGKKQQRQSFEDPLFSAIGINNLIIGLICLTIGCGGLVAIVNWFLTQPSIVWCSWGFCFMLIIWIWISLKREDTNMMLLLLYVRYSENCCLSKAVITTTSEPTGHSYSE